MHRGQRAYSRRSLGAREFDILSQASLGDVLMAHLLSGRSSKAFYKNLRERAVARQSDKRSTRSLITKGYLVEHSGELSISSAGTVALEKEIARLRLQSEDDEVGDGTYSLVSYDIPERLRSLRAQLRYVLKRAGFKLVHHSLWVLPRDCKELTLLLKENPVLQKHVLYFTAQSLGDDAALHKLISARTRKRAA